MPIQLRKYNLEVNAGKTEKYEIPRPLQLPPPTIETLIVHKIIWYELDWLINYTQLLAKNNKADRRKCKLPGSLLDTQSDIIRRID